MRGTKAPLVAPGPKVPMNKRFEHYDQLFAEVFKRFEKYDQLFAEILKKLEQHDQLFAEILKRLEQHVFVIARPATYLGDLIVHNGDNRMVRKPAALDAVIVDYITKSIFHSYLPQQYSR